MDISFQFEEFWKAYPRHNGGVIQNRKAFTKALKVASAEEIITGALKYALDPNRLLEVTAYPATWLNQCRWNDLPLAPQSLHTGARKLNPAEFSQKPLDPEKIAKLRRENGL